MKIDIPKVIVSIDMGEYAPELKGRCLKVWVNPPLDVLTAHLTMAAKMTQEATTQAELLQWYADLWSQGEADSRWTLDELRAIEQDDPAFLSWMITATWEARRAHMDRKKKV
jgi:hypothetical protein